MAGTLRAVKLGPLHYAIVLAFGALIVWKFTAANKGLEQASVYNMLLQKEIEQFMYRAPKPPDSIPESFMEEYLNGHKEGWYAFMGYGYRKLEDPSVPPSPPYILPERIENSSNLTPYENGVRDGFYEADDIAYRVWMTPRKDIREDVGIAFSVYIAETIPQAAIDRLDQR